MAARFILIARNLEMTKDNPYPEIMKNKYNGKPFFTHAEVSAIVKKHGGKVFTGLDGMFARIGLPTSAQRLRCANEIKGIYPEFAMMNQNGKPIL